MKNKFLKHFFGLIIIAAGLLFFRLALAQDFGLTEVESGLGGSLSADDPRTIAGRIINVLLGFLGVIALGLIIYAGFLWMSSGGEEEKISRAKKLLTNAAIGLAIILASWAIATFVINRLSDATRGGGSNSSCLTGEIMSCGCGGMKTCLDGSWQPCVGSNCGAGEFGQTRCDSSPLPGCQADSNICAPQNYCDENCYCRPRGDVGDSCDADKSTPACNANNDLCGEFLSCDASTCTCYGPPVITSISPSGGFCQEDKNKSCRSDADCSSSCNKMAPNGAPENFLTISGKGFGAYQEGVSQVIFISGNRTALNPSSINPVCVNFWSDSQIIIAVPSGASDGPIKVVRADGLEDISDNDYGPKLPNFVANNIVRPGLCLLNPGEGELSAVVTYQGVNLNNGAAYFGSYQSSVQALNSNFSFPGGTSGTGQVPNIRSGSATSFVVSTLGGNQENSNYLRFTKTPDPREGAYIVSFSPTQGRAGQYVTIQGSGFGGVKGGSRVYFGDTEAEYSFPPVCANSVWSDNQVIVKVPSGISNGNYFIRMTIGEKTINTSELNPNVFQANDALALKTSICKLEPQQGAVSTPVKIYGEYFGQENGSGVAQFSIEKNTSGVIKKENSADVLAVAVPVNAITGPVRVVKNGEWGNEVNFTISNCTSNDHCPGQVCCPANTYKKGRCVNSLIDCLIDIPTSVFEWKFSTGYVNPGQTDPTESCASIARSLGACQVGVFCPNAPGVCSPYPGGNEGKVGDCDFSCASISGCGGGLGSSTCTYDPAINKCSKNGLAGICSLPKKQSFEIQGQSYEFNLTCNNEGRWQFTTPMSCPEGWERGVNNSCINRTLSCDSCSGGLSCERVASDGRCVSNSICPAGSVCKDNLESPLDRCVATDGPSCDCCCRIANSAQDCCPPLQCTGTCGQDSSDDGVGYGRCSGCAAAGATAADRDNACNCTGNSGRYCSITSERPDGVCADCSGLKTQEACAEHASSCCFDAKTNTCRGGSGTTITNNPGDADYGFCGYFNCSASDPTACAAATPVKLGFFKDVPACERGCAAGTDPCNQFNGNKETCTAMGSCCYDFTSSICRQGGQISSGLDAGYCAYYNCGDPAATPPGNPQICDNNPKTTGTFNDLSTCSLVCGGGFSGAGQDCVAPSSVLACNFSLCNYPSMSCLTASGAVASDVSACGTCCCNPNDPNACNIGGVAGVLSCQPNQGRCSGASRGLCCGCRQDSDCVGSGLAENVGCGLDTCCQARPKIESSSPQNNDANVCRNAVIQVTFNQIMNSTTFDANILLIQEMNYGSGACPSGSFVYDNFNSRPSGIFDRIARFFKIIKTASDVMITRIFRSQLSALANLPDQAKLYCTTPITISAEHSQSTTTAIIRPRALLAPDAKYYVVVKGDELLNSRLGVASIFGIGMNGEGLLLESGAVEGKDIKFNNTSYINSHIFQFRTLSDKEANAGVCKIASVKLRPASYLFKTTNNSLDENDINSSHQTFDTKYDKDKVFSAWAYSFNGQAIHPVTGYFWIWDFNLTNSTIASLKTRTDLPGLDPNRVFVAAREGVTEGESKLIAAVNMTPFQGANASSNPSCVCSDPACSNRCLNIFSDGDDLLTTSDIYIFICDNPWPSVSSSGEWYPWRDTCDGSIGDCTNFNYKFYYCRDAGQSGTHDDLPAITNQAVIRGQSSVLACTANNQPCNQVNTRCGEDRNGDGTADGVCTWTVLKDSYFFREEILSAGEISVATDNKTGGSVLVSWSSASDKVGSYKIYYGPVGQATSLYKEFKLGEMQNGAPVCLSVGMNNVCNAIISGLKDDQAYNFRLTILTSNQAESSLSAAKVATPTDQTPPQIPTNLAHEITEGQIKFTWSNSDASASFHRLYRGITSGLYGESFDSAHKSFSINLPISTLSPGNNYFALSAVDAAKNESQKSDQLIVYRE